MSFSNVQRGSFWWGGQGSKWLHHRFSWSILFCHVEGKGWLMPYSYVYTEDNPCSANFTTRRSDAFH